MSQPLTLRRVLGLTTLLALTWVAATLAGAGVFRETAHGGKTSGVRNRDDPASGSCGQCHSERDDGARNEKGLWRENDNELCFTCHRSEDVVGVYPGQRVYQASPHAIDSRVVWPGPEPKARKDLDAAGKCLNCHDPHGAEDRAGLIPELLRTRENKLCLACHDGNPADSDIARELAKPYAHAPRKARGGHVADEGGDPGRYAYSGGSRHVTCSDCHNAHASYPDGAPPVPPEASLVNAWVSRVRALNSSAGSLPTYEYLTPLAGGDVLEYEICFKCHSSWTLQPPGQPDMGMLLNPNNASHHAVEGRGNNPGIHTAAFVPGYDASSIIRCSDCHGSDDSATRGPHGSQNPNILKRPYRSDGGQAFASDQDLCFLCHNYDTYANPLGTALDASRFNPKRTRAGHSFHVGEQNVSCHSCHESHGSPRHIALMVTGRFPGLVRYSSTRVGGTCQSTCHEPRTYSINYPR